MIDLPKQHINVAMNDGGIGDQIARLPVIKYCLDRYPHVSFDCWSPDYFIPVARNALRGYEDRCQFVSLSRMKPPFFNPDLMAVGFLTDSHTTLRTHLVDHGFNIMNDGLPPIEYRNYLKLRMDEIDTADFKLTPGTYVCLTPGYTAVVRALLPAAWNEIAAWLVTKGLVPVWLGASEAPVNSGIISIKAQLDEEIDYTVGIDLRNKTSLLEAGKLMGYAKAVVGLDNGLIHLAAMSYVVLVAGYTSVDPAVRLPYRRNMLGWNCRIVVPDESLTCRFCQVKAHFVYSHDFRTCLTGTLDCIRQLTAKKFIDELKEIC